MYAPLQVPDEKEHAEFELGTMSVGMEQKGRSDG